MNYWHKEIEAFKKSDKSDRKVKKKLVTWHFWGHVLIFLSDIKEHILTYPQAVFRNNSTSKSCVSAATFNLCKKRKPIGAILKTLNERNSVVL